ncbi:MAG: fumarylacetoacetate hydrolase family protein [Pyrinomonadaceae bacterium]
MKLKRVAVEDNETYQNIETGEIAVTDSPIGFEKSALENAVWSQPTGAYSEIELVSPSKIVCVGRNYADHAKELGNDVPSAPLLFLKAPSSLAWNQNVISLPEQSTQVEHEGELAIVIGRKASKMAATEDPLNYVFGYCCLNDVTARDVQRADVQFTRGKSFDTFCPIGPHIETELMPAVLSLRVYVNGEIRQSGNTSDMIFDIPYLIRYISNQMTLLPGDIVATGTPAGVSKLRNGDTCTVEIEGIGRLENKVE